METPPLPTRDDWINIFRPLKYEFYESYHYRIIVALNFIALIVVIGGTFYFDVAYKMVHVAFICSYILVINRFNIIGHIKRVGMKDFQKKLYSDGRRFYNRQYGFVQNELESFEPKHKYITNVRIIPGGVKIKIKAKYGFRRIDIVNSLSFDFMIYSIQYIINYYFGLFVLSTIIVYKFAPSILLPMQYLIIFWLTLLGTCIMLWSIGKQRERKAQNPLHGILEVGK